MYKFQELEIKKQKRIDKKNRIVESIIDDLKNNIYDSEDYIFNLVRESLLRRTNKELLQINV
jgi:hypothetical protein